MFNKADYCVGALYADGVWLCNTLEPHAICWTKEYKRAGRTAIPCGTYRLQWGYSPKFGKHMPYLLDVPNFLGVMIHTGNTVADTRGCILVGLNTRRGMLTQSRICYRRVAERIHNGDTLEVVEECNM